MSETKEHARWKYVYDEVARRYRVHGFDLDEMVDAELSANAGNWVDAQTFFDRLESDIARAAHQGGDERA